MKKALLVLVFISLILPMTCLATGAELYPNGGGAAPPAAGGEEEKDPLEELIAIIDRIKNIVLIILLSLAGAFVLVAGFFFVTAGGDPNMVGKGRQMLIFALVGVAVAGLAELIVRLIRHLLDIEIPQPPT